MLSTINYWLTMFFLCFHPLIMVVAYDFWANWHPLLLANSLQQLLLGAFCWAIPDVKYESWIKDKLWIFYILAVLNVAQIILGGAISVFLYCYGSALYSFISAAFMVYLVLGSGPLVLVLATSFFLILKKFYGKPQGSPGNEEEDG